uniref:Uncharacterized protein n=1 Tax=Populus trichocarpa TaxID=3694 RepID=A0A3N7ERA0_POPTR
MKNAAQWISNQSHILTDHFDDKSKKHAMSINSKTIARSLAVEKLIDAKTNLRNRNARGWQRDSFQRIRGYDFNDNVDSTAPYFVRSWAPKLARNSTNRDLA